MLKKLLKFILIPVICAVSVSVLFVAVALIPQSAIQKNASLSAEQLISQPQWPTVINNGDASYTLDNYTDSQILMQSYNLNMDEPKSVFSNPKHISAANKNNMAVALNEVVNEGAENETYYIYYWMGFRIFIRPLLLFTSYNGIRKIVALLFWVLLFTALITVAKKANTKTAICLGIAIALINPAIVSQSLQFSCLFLLTCVFLIYLCCFRKETTPLTVVFCTFGVLTQIFDFYTTPIITYGIPILVWYAMSNTLPTSKKFGIGFKCLITWGWGYGFVWILKLVFATCFSGINAFAMGFKAFAGRTGIVVVEELADKYDALKALKSVWFTIFSDPFGKVVFCIAVLAIFVFMVLIYLKKGLFQLFDRSMPLFAAALPVIWYIIAAQPTVIHAWFQYRSLVVMIFGIAIFMANSFKLLTVEDTKGEKNNGKCIFNHSGI